MRMRRRNFLSALAGVPATCAIGRPKPPTNVKITDIRVRQLKLIRDVGSIEPAWNPGSKMSFRIGGGSFVEVASMPVSMAPPTATNASTPNDG